MASTLPVEPMVRASYEAARQHTERLRFAQAAGRATRDDVDAARADELRLEAALAALHGRLSLPSASPETVVNIASASTPGRLYRVTVSPDGDTCQYPNDEGGWEVCRGFKFRGSCSHITRARALVDDPCRTLARDITDAWNGTSATGGRDAWWRDLTVMEQALGYSLSEIEGTGRPSDPVGAELAAFIRTAEKAAVRVRARASAIYRAAEASLARDSERQVAG